MTINSLKRVIVIVFQKINEAESTIFQMLDDSHVLFIMPDVLLEWKTTLHVCMKQYFYYPGINVQPILKLGKMTDSKNIGPICNPNSQVVVLQKIQPHVLSHHLIILYANIHDGIFLNLNL